MNNQNLFSLMSREHGVTLLESELQEIISAIKKDDWVKVKTPDDVPRHGRKVIAFYKIRDGRMSRRVMAKYLQGYTDECQCEHECDCEYSDLHDCAYYREGWYEVVENYEEWGFIPIDEGNVTHWMPLPSCPVE